MTHHTLDDAIAATGGLSADLMWRPQPGELPTHTTLPYVISTSEVGKVAGVKHDGEKTNLSLLPFEALEEVGKVLTFGAKKYAAHNWRGGFKWSRLGGAALRHTFAWLRGESKDPETGLSHLAHAACCLLFLISFEVTKTGEDDRYRVEV